MGKQSRLTCPRGLAARVSRSNDHEHQDQDEENLQRGERRMRCLMQVSCPPCSQAERFLYHVLHRDIKRKKFEDYVYQEKRARPISLSTSSRRSLPLISCVLLSLAFNYCAHSSWDLRFKPQGKCATARIFHQLCLCLWRCFTKKHAVIRLPNLPNLARADSPLIVDSALGALISIRIDWRCLETNQPQRTPRLCARALWFGKILTQLYQA
jgi:hypothetical protein